MMNNNYFVLFSNCLITKGAVLSSISDMQNGSIFLVPNEVIAVFRKIRDIAKYNYNDYYDNETVDIIYEYIQFFEENNLGFWAENPNMFPEINRKWRHPSIITNSILEIDKKNDYNFIIKFLENLNYLNCKAIEIRLVSESYYNISEIKSILNIVRDSTLQHITIVIRFLNSVRPIDWNMIFAEFPRLFDVYIFNSTTPNNITFNKKKIVRYLKEDFSNITCGKINKNRFTVNIFSYTESLVHNSCLNRSISVDSKGNIKQCPSMPQTFGNIKDTTIEKALKNKGFKKYWNITKDNIKVCKDCEYRYICTDCRAYIEDAEDIYSKPLKCGYNPYTNKWEEWSTNPLKQKAIEYYGMQDLVKKNNA